MLKTDGTRIDRASQKFLGALKVRGPCYSAELRDVAELEQNTQVSYRMDRYLVPAGLVEESPRDEDRPPGYEQPREWSLTEAGEEWIAAHVDEIVTPATRAETQQMARDAKDEAHSAKESVQKYRKKLSRMKREVQDIGERVREVDKRHSMDYEGLKGTIKKSDRNETDIEQMQQSIDGLRAAFRRDQRATAAQDAAIVDAIEELNTRLERVESKLDGVLRQQAEREHAHAQGGVLGGFRS